MSFSSVASPRLSHRPGLGHQRKGKKALRRQKLLCVAFASVVSVATLRHLSAIAEDSGFFEQSVPDAPVLRRAIATYLSLAGGQQSSSFRDLSRDLGNGDCDWLPPEKLNATYTPPPTLLVSYPGSGKRLTWRTIEALTGYVTGDDWDLSEEGQNVATMKTSYPHPEGIWSWGSQMSGAKIVMILRNPRFAISSYQTIRYELDYSNSWQASYVRRPNTYTERPNIAEWEWWRDALADREIDKWASYVDFWMKDGHVRYDSKNESVKDYHCRPENGMMTSCLPSVILSFERLYGPGGAQEVQKLSNALEEGRPDMPIISQEARECVFVKTNEKRATETNWDNSARDGHGPAPDEKKFTAAHLQKMVDVIDDLIGNYTESPWDVDPIAVDLVGILQGYKTDVEAELAATSR